MIRKYYHLDECKDQDSVYIYLDKLQDDAKIYYENIESDIIMIKRNWLNEKESKQLYAFFEKNDVIEYTDIEDDEDDEDDDFNEYYEN